MLPSKTIAIISLRAWLYSGRSFRVNFESGEDQNHLLFAMLQGVDNLVEITKA